MVVRGNFRPPTLVTEDVFERSFNKFRGEEDVREDRSVIMAELTLENLTQHDRIDVEDFQARADLINAMGQKVIVSDCSEHQKLINYLSDYKIHQLGIVIGIRELRDLIIDKYEKFQDGDLLVAFGQLFTRNIRVYVYPALNDDLTEIITLDTLHLPEGIRFLYRFLIDQELIVQVDEYDAGKLSIIPHGVFKMIKSGKSGWEQYIPEKLVRLIKEKQLFYYQGDQTKPG